MADGQGDGPGPAHPLSAEPAGPTSNAEQEPGRAEPDGRRIGLRLSSAAGFARVFVALVAMRPAFEKVPTAMAFLLPVPFILCHSAGPGANGKSIAALSYSSDVRALGTGVTGMVGSFGSVVGLYVFPQIKDSLGPTDTFLVLSVVPLIGLITYLLIKWDPPKGHLWRRGFRAPSWPGTSV
ncbi:MFS transporter [Streptomyces sp. NPDC056112]|uniref:MFS transporter n=1 Tax=Streptomyces sp. NPDC056112 TaxID=3345715 RepID=UPI002480EF90|nr:MFS transporter [Streptomyces sp. HYC2]